MALGSYARCEVCPASDVDLLFLHGGWPAERLSTLVQELCYPLWDAGLELGHAVRRPAEAPRAAAEDVETATALIERRLVAGEAGLLDELADRMASWRRSNGRGVMAALEDAGNRRRAHAGWRVGMLEPHLKEGAGGLRDLHALRWAATYVVGAPGLDPLVSAGYLSATDRRDLASAGRVLLRARCALHLARAGDGTARSKDVDRLRLDLQDEAARRLGHVEVGGRGDGGELLREVGLVMRSISYLHDRTWPSLAEDASRGRRFLRSVLRPRRGPDETPLGEGLFVRDRTLAIEGDRTVAGEHALPLRALAAAASRGLSLERATADRLRGEVAQIGRLSWDAAGLHALTTVLRAGTSALPALADADHLGVLTALWPEWSRVRGRPQRNPFHLFDLDTHHQQTVAVLAEVAGGGLAEQHALLWQGLPDQDALLLAAFLHDVGKAWPGDHSVVGAEIAGGMVRQAGLDEERAAWVAVLVRLHLLLPDVATRRDIDDPEELRAVADEVHDAATLDALYLLSLADARATGPTATSPWKEELLAELHRRVRPLVSGADTPALPDPVAVAARLRAEAPNGADALLEVVGPRYLVAAGSEQAAAHVALDAPHVNGLRAGVRPSGVDGPSVVSVVAPDRPGLLARCAGVLAGHGLEVLDARLFTTRNGVALDWFVVRPRRAREAPAWVQVMADLEAADRGRLDIERLVERRERRRDERRPALVAPVPVDVRIDDAGLRVEVHAPDGPAVLYRLARALTEAGADVLGARVATLGPKVRDVFFLASELTPAERTALAEAVVGAVA